MGDYYQKYLKYKKKYINLKSMNGGEYIKTINKFSPEFNDKMYPFNHGVDYNILFFFGILTNGILMPKFSGVRGTQGYDSSNKISLGSLQKGERTSFQSYLPLQFFVKYKPYSIATHDQRIDGEYYSYENIGIDDIIAVIDKEMTNKEYKLLNLSYGFFKYKHGFDSYLIKTDDDLKNKVSHQLEFINKTFSNLDSSFIPFNYDDIPNESSMKDLNNFIHTKISDSLFKDLTLEMIMEKYFMRIKYYIFDENTYLYRDYSGYEYDTTLKIIN